MRKVVTCWKLGKEGRFGNSLGIYCFLKGYSRSIDAELCVPGDWVGRRLFHVPESPIDSAPLHTRNLDEHLAERWEGVTGDIFSFGQHQRFIDFYSRTDARQWLTLRPEWQQYEADLLRQFPSSYSACHLRRGDYTVSPALQRYCVLTAHSYRRAIGKLSVPEPFLWIEEGWRLPGQPAVAADLPFLDDFLLLKNAAHLLRSNSTFAYWAAVLGHGAVYSPVVGRMTGWRDCEFVKGNWPCTAAGFSNQSDLHLKE